jgi:hypothetical protein
MNSAGLTWLFFGWRLDKRKTSLSDTRDVDVTTDWYCQNCGTHNFKDTQIKDHADDIIENPDIINTEVKNELLTIKELANLITKNSSAGINQ